MGTTCSCLTDEDMGIEQLEQGQTNWENFQQYYSLSGDEGLSTLGPMQSGLRRRLKYKGQSFCNRTPYNAMRRVHLAVQLCSKRMQISKHPHGVLWPIWGRGRRHRTDCIGPIIGLWKGFDPIIAEQPGQGSWRWQACC